MTTSIGIILVRLRRIGNHKSRVAAKESFSSLSDLDTWNTPTLKRPVPREFSRAFRSPSSSPYAPFPEHPEISIVLPCLNEEEAIGGCISTLQRIIAEQHLSAEIVVVDNASTDRSAEIAQAHGARVVYQPVRGYGNAYRKGFAEAKGTYIVMADADNTYDLSEVNEFVPAPTRRVRLCRGQPIRWAHGKGRYDLLTSLHRQSDTLRNAAYVLPYKGT